MYPDIGPFQVLDRLGEGGMGTVYRAHDTLLERDVALKALRPELARNADLVDRFRQEARVLARLLHPHIATLYTMHREGEDLYMVMEFVEGETLEDRLRRDGRLTPGQAVAVLAQTLDGLTHAHTQGVVHRDLKPANLMITPAGAVKIMDFGIARVLGTQRMTRTRMAVGTPEYMAPEQVRGQDLDGRADLYALGIVGFEMLTGQVPFAAESEFEVMQAHIQQAPPTLSALRADVPDALVGVFERALAKEPGDRYPSAQAFREALLAAVPPEVLRPAPKPTRMVAPPTRVYGSAPSGAMYGSAPSGAMYGAAPEGATRVVQATAPGVGVATQPKKPLALPGRAPLWVGGGVGMVALVGLLFWWGTRPAAPDEEAAPPPQAFVTPESSTPATSTTPNEPQYRLEPAPGTGTTPGNPSTPSATPPTRTPTNRTPATRQPTYADAARAAMEAQDPPARSEETRPKEPARQEAPPQEPPRPQPAAAGGTVVLNSTPSGAEVYVGGSLKGRTPLQLVALRPGRHTFEFRRAGYVNVVRVVRVTAGGTQSVQVQMQQSQ